MASQVDTITVEFKLKCIRDLCTALKLSDLERSVDEHNELLIQAFTVVDGLECAHRTSCLAHIPSWCS